ncbi:hypothetical protein JQ594_24300 [Bradyrhizobium manausense]|nr:hypothetical protein [Bradyrhizobium manausense]MBR0689067.1 hypothetical protein [Bradyrhizobium manausense]
MTSKLRNAIMGLTMICSMVSPTVASEIVYAPFDLPDGVASVGKYSGTVSITVAGLGQALANLYSDAFYTLNAPPTGPADFHFWNLGFSTSGSGLFEAENYLVGSVPAFNPTGIYTFELNTGASGPTQLYFGVHDDVFSDNSGAYVVVITQLASSVPELSTWAMMVLGFAGMGLMAYRRRHQATRSSAVVWC